MSKMDEYIKTLEESFSTQIQNLHEGMDERFKQNSMKMEENTRELKSMMEAFKKEVIDSLKVIGQRDGSSGEDRREPLLPTPPTPPEFTRSNDGGSSRYGFNQPTHIGSEASRGSENRGYPMDHGEGLRVRAPPIERMENHQSSKGYGQEVVGEKVKVWWPKDNAFYAGKIESFHHEKGKHTIVYNDGDVEVLNLKRTIFEFFGSETKETNEKDAPVHDDSDPDAASDRPVKKKVKMNHDQSKKKVKSNVTPNKSVGASSAKSKSASSKSAPKVKGSSKTDGKLLDGMESDKTMEDVFGSKSKDQKPKSGSKSANVSKSSGKLRDDDKLANASKSKEDAEPSKSKQETPKSSKVKVHSSSVEKGKPNASGSKQKAKDRTKEDKDEEENSMESEEAEETPKLKATSSSKVRGSESKSNKKRRKA